jgi:uncharacterized protein YbjT (DUF2867 family)
VIIYCKNNLKGGILSETNTNKKNLESLFVLVTGATGKQGGSVARKLLERGHRVRGLTRNKESYKAKELEKLGVEVVEGDFGYAPTLINAMESVDAVFAMTTPFEKGDNFELKSGYLLEHAAISIGIRHIVFSSVASADQETGISHFNTKFKIENFIKSKKIPYTIIRPVYFMENLISSWMLSELEQGRISTALIKDRKLQMITVEDIANFVVYIFEHREQFLEKTIEIASDEVSMEEVAEILSRILGKHFKYNKLSYEDIRNMGEDFVNLHKWLNEKGFRVDILNLHNKYPEINWYSFKEWAKKQYRSTINELIKQKII